MKNYPLWFWFSIIVVFVGETLFILFGLQVFDRPDLFLQSALIVTFVLHPLYMIVSLAFLWRQKQDTFLLIKAGLLMLLPIWIVWFLFLSIHQVG